MRRNTQLKNPKENQLNITSYSSKIFHFGIFLLRIYDFTMKKTIYSNSQKKLVGKIRKARKGAGFSQLELGKKLKRGQSYISKIESGQIRLDVIELKTISKILKRKIEDFI